MVTRGLKEREAAETQCRPSPLLTPGSRHTPQLRPSVQGCRPEEEAELRAGRTRRQSRAAGRRVHPSADQGLPCVLSFQALPKALSLVLLNQAVR